MQCRTNPRWSKGQVAPWDREGSPEVDNGVTCGDCMALVLAEKYGGRCDRYCESFGQVCIMAAEEQEENCEVGVIACYSY